jgi:hypothetical protein
VDVEIAADVVDLDKFGERGGGGGGYFSDALSHLGRDIAQA